VSATTGQGLSDLRDAIRVAASGSSLRDPTDLFRMPIDRAFSVRGAGTVVTGTTWSGTVRVGETLGIQPGDMTARVRSLQVHGSEREEVGPGIRCAMALVGVDAARVDRGSVVLGPGNWRPSSRLGVRLEVPPGSVREVDHGQRVRLFLGTSEVMARVRTVKRDAVSAGGRGWAVLDCEQPVVARVGDRFVLRFYSPVTTVGGGEVCALDPPRGWRAQVDGWSAVLDGSPGDAVVAAVSAAGGRGLKTGDVPLIAGIASTTADGLLERSTAVTRVGGAWYDRTSVDTAAAAVLDHLRAAHARRRRSSAESLEAVRAGLSVRFSTDLVEFVVGRLASAGEVVVEGPGIRLAGHEPSLNDTEEQALRELQAVLVAADLAPPSPPDLAAAIGVDRELLNDLLKLLVERGLAVRVTPEVFVMRSAEERARETIRRLSSSGAVPPGEFRQALGLSRKHLIPLLEYMDRAGVTRRTPEGRISNEVD
jgi:selenocysteine-specific elongation factor